MNRWKTSLVAAGVQLVVAGAILAVSFLPGQDGGFFPVRQAGPGMAVFLTFLGLPVVLLLPGRHGLALALGEAVGVLVGLLLAGPAIVAVLAALVICTGGISLLVILPACYGAGWLCLGIWDSFPHSPAAPEPVPAVLTDYVRKARKQGKNEADIERNLTEAGWGAAEIQRARELV